jgi:hypothetical protein
MHPLRCFPHFFLAGLSRGAQNNSSSPNIIGVLFSQRARGSLLRVEGCRNVMDLILAIRKHCPGLDDGLLRLHPRRMPESYFEHNARRKSLCG